jgi:4-hydroxythreonine-4-phosphate dehydrogenase
LVKPRIGITVGDPAGIGPEIARKAADDARVRAVCDPVLYGPPSGTSFTPGVLSAEAGRAAYDAICAAVRDAQAGRVAAIATAPINKLAFARAGLPWKGHTDLLGHLTGSSRVAMMFWSEPLKVVLATVHVPLSEVPVVLTREVMDGTIDLTSRELPRFLGPPKPDGEGDSRPRLAVAGLNPHAGEEGLLGEEERTVICPSIEAARGRGIRIEGPLPGDTVFVRATKGEFDAVIACYHDQGLIPVKLLAFGQAVNVTLGLPIVRTSVDHGTAFDIAGKGVADAGSMIEAVLLAARLTRHHVEAGP